MRALTRRHLIQGSSLLAASALLSACGKGEEEKIKPGRVLENPRLSHKRILRLHRRVWLLGDTSPIQQSQLFLRGWRGTCPPPQIHRGAI